MGEKGQAAEKPYTTQNWWRQADVQRGLVKDFGSAQNLKNTSPAKLWKTKQHRQVQGEIREWNRMTVRVFDAGNGLETSVVEVYGNCAWLEKLTWNEKKDYKTQWQHFD